MAREGLAQLPNGPVYVAGGNTDDVARRSDPQLWATDGSYNVEGWAMRSRADVAAMVRSGAHQGLIGRGSSHFLGPAVVTVDGDEAVAVCESVLLVRRDNGYVAVRAGANYLRLRRIDEQWQIVARTTRALDGSAEARELPADGVAGRVR